MALLYSIVFGEVVLGAEKLDVIGGERVAAFGPWDDVVEVKVLVGATLPAPTRLVVNRLVD